MNFEDQKAEALRKLGIFINQYKEQKCDYETTHSIGYSNHLSAHCQNRSQVIDFVQHQATMILGLNNLSVDFYDNTNKSIDWALVRRALATKSDNPKYQNHFNRLELLRQISIQFEFGQ